MASIHVMVRNGKIFIQLTILKTAKLIEGNRATTIKLVTKGNVFLITLPLVVRFSVKKRSFKHAQNL